MTLSHDDISIGDRVYSPQQSQVYRVEDKDKNHLLLSPESGVHRENPRRILTPVNGLHWGLQSWESYKAIAKLTDQLNAMPRGRLL